MWKRPFLLSDPSDLNRKFYSVYDERFLARKVDVLHRIFSNPQLLAELAEAETNQDLEFTKQGIAAEILFAEFHQFESFMALLSAPFQDLPHWIFLATYRTEEIRKRAEMFANQDYLSFSNGRFADRESVLRAAVYNGFGDDNPDQSRWISTFENLEWMISRMALRYNEADEFNSYKHGLRLFSSEYKIAFGDKHGDFSRALVLGEEFSITHLKLEKHQEGTLVRIVSKGYNPEESMEYIFFMAGVLANIKRSRLAPASEANPIQITLMPHLDRKRIVELARCTRSSRPA